MTTPPTSLSRCGSHLDSCRCRYTGPKALSAAEMQARHLESVARAVRSGWAARTGHWRSR